MNISPIIIYNTTIYCSHISYTTHTIVITTSSNFTIIINITSIITIINAITNTTSTTTNATSITISIFNTSPKIPNTFTITTSKMIFL